MAQQEKPLISLVLLAYNQEAYIVDAVRAALAQTYTPLEIIVSDDRSTDGTWPLIEQEAARYAGPHSVRLNRNASNLGIGAHVDRLLRMATGAFVVLAAGDDIARPERVQRIADCVIANPAVRAVYSQVDIIDESGAHVRKASPVGEHRVDDIRRFVEDGNMLLGAASAVSPEVVRAFAPLPKALTYCEDVVLPFRAALLGEIVVLDDALVEYREHGHSLMGRLGQKSPSYRSYIDGVRQVVLSYDAALATQIDDIAHAEHAGLVDRGKALALTRRRHELREKHRIYPDLLFGRPGALRLWAAQTLAGQRSLKESVKLLLMGAMPRLWFWYLRLTARWPRRGAGREPA